MKALRMMMENLQQICITRKCREIVHYHISVYFTQIILIFLYPVNGSNTIWLWVAVVGRFHGLLIVWCWLSLVVGCRWLLLVVVGCWLSLVVVGCRWLLAVCCCLFLAVVNCFYFCLVVLGCCSLFVVACSFCGQLWLAVVRCCLFLLVAVNR